MLGEPAFGSRLVTGNAQGVAFFAQQGIAAITGTKTLDFHVFRKMHDEPAVGVELANGVQALHKSAFPLYSAQCRVAHTGHQVHIDDNVRTVRYFYATT